MGDNDSYIAVYAESPLGYHPSLQDSPRLAWNICIEVNFMQKPLRKDRHKPGYQTRFNAENYHQFYLRIRKDSGIMDALRNMSAETGVSVNAYITETVKRQLIADGYMPET